MSGGSLESVASDMLTAAENMSATIFRGGRSVICLASGQASAPRLSRQLL